MKGSDARFAPQHGDRRPPRTAVGSPTVDAEGSPGRVRPGTTSMRPCPSSGTCWSRSSRSSIVGFLVLEMFLFKSPAGRRIFRTTPEYAAQAAPLAANQGLYNGFLAAGLFWSLSLRMPLARPLRLFFLACVLVAAVFGAATVSRRILVIQGLPALPGAVVSQLLGMSRCAEVAASASWRW